MDRLGRWKGLCGAIYPQRAFRAPFWGAWFQCWKSWSLTSLFIRRLSWPTKWDEICCLKSSQWFQILLDSWPFFSCLMRPTETTPQVDTEKCRLLVCEMREWILAHRIFYEINLHLGCSIPMVHSFFPPKKRDFPCYYAASRNLIFERGKFFPNSNSFGVFSHSIGFGAELLSDSMVLWAAKRFCGRFQQGSTKVIFLVFLGGSLSFPKRLCGGPPMTSFHLCPSSFNFFLHFSPAVLQEMDFASDRFPGVFPKLFCKFRLRVSRVFLGWMVDASEKVQWRVPPLFSTFVSQMAVAW